MDQSSLFCSGLELAKLVVSSDLLKLSWSKISELSNVDRSQQLNLKLYREAEFTVIAFVASPECVEEGLQISSSTFLDGSSLFKFLCSDSISSFSVHSPAIQLFQSVFEQLCSLRSQIAASDKLIITGYSLGGSVAAMFTLWLLDSLKPGTKRPLCITFGAPLIGDTSLQQILQNSIWNSCFLHVAATLDPVPGLFTGKDSIFKPSGTFLMCSESRCTCLEDPETVSELLRMVGGAENQVLDDWLLRNVYARAVKNWFSRMNLVKGTSRFGTHVEDSVRAGMMLQLEDIGIGSLQGPQNDRTVNDLAEKMEKRERETVARKKKAFDPSRKLNAMKINMIQLEWYKKLCREQKGVNYYDFYRQESSEVNIKVSSFKTELTAYWKSMVEEARKKPQSETAAFRLRWLGSGTNYRRMVEPLDIAEHYGNGKRDYRRSGRSRHYVLMEKWFEDGEKPERGLRKSRDLMEFLTLDSCFWADVEEARILCRRIENREDRDCRKLREFEEKLMEKIENFDVSPEIFLRESSFMKWWKEYEMIVVKESYSSLFTEFMRRGMYTKYGKSG